MEERAAEYRNHKLAQLEEARARAENPPKRKEPAAHLTPAYAHAWVQRKKFKAAAPAASGTWSAIT